MKKEAFYRPLTILMPIAAVLCATGVSVYEWRLLKRLEDEAAATQAKITQIDRELRSYEAQPQTEKFPTVPKTPREQAQFLDALRANADVAGVQLVRWSNTTPAPTPSSSPPTAGASTGVSSIVSIIEVSGHAVNTRSFLYNVVRSRRLLNMADIKWARDSWPNTHLTFTLTRYVAPPVPLPLSSVRPAHLDNDPISAAAAQHAVNASATSVEPTARVDRGGSVSLPNPMDAPGIAHGAYQSRLEAGVSQLNDIDRSNPSASSRPPAVPNAKR